VYKNRAQLQGLDFEYEPPFLRHFTAKLKPVEATQKDIIAKQKVALAN